MGATLGNLSGGRVDITGTALVYLKLAMAIGVRYSAARRQFGPPDKEEEVPVLEYPMQVGQMKLWV